MFTGFLRWFFFSGLEIGLEERRGEVNEMRVGKYIQERKDEDGVLSEWRSMHVRTGKIAGEFRDISIGKITCSVEVNRILKFTE
jgi:hypothetical protein